MGPVGMERNGSDWLEAIVVVAFHVEHGQVIEDVYSMNSTLSEAAKRKICSLSLPDSNSGQNGDVQFIFRFRNNVAPLHSTVIHEEDFMYCSAFFRQIKDKTLKRGYFQKSLVLVSKNPYNTFLEDCSYVIGPLFFEFGRNVIEAILQDINSWPAPCSGKSFQLPIAGCVLNVDVPIVSEDVQNKMKRTFEIDAGSVMDIAEDEVKASSPLPERRFIYETSNGGHILKKKELQFNIKPRAGTSPTNQSESSIHTSKAGQGLEIHEFERMAKMHEKQGNVRGDLETCQNSVTMDSDNNCEQDGSQTFNFAAVLKNPEENVPGLYQDIPLFSTFGGLSVALWHIWELALVGDPILVLAPTPNRCSQAVLAIASLIAPIPYCGDYRPYFTIYDSDFMEISRKHDELKGQNLPSCVLGVTNPYFLKSLEYWPNVISMGGTGPSTTALARSVTPPPKSPNESATPSTPPTSVRSPRSGIEEVQRRSQAEKEETFLRILQSSSRKNRSSGTLTSHLSRADSLCVEGKDIKSARYHPNIAKRGESIRALLTDQKYERSIILTRDRPMVPPDKNVLRRLLNEHDAAKASAMVGTDFAECCMAEHPVLAVNNAALRRHFQELTKCFLKPLEKFLKLESVGSRAARSSSVSVGAYDYPLLTLEQFNKDLFLYELEREGPPKELVRADWRELYSKFIDGPHFRPWFELQRKEFECHLTFIYRHLRLNMDSDVLLQLAGAAQQLRRKVLQTSSSPSNLVDNCAMEATGRQLVENDKATGVYSRIKRALDDELAKTESERDLELVAKIQEHLNVVQTLLSMS